MHDFRWNLRALAFRISSCILDVIARSQDLIQYICANLMHADGN